MRHLLLVFLLAGCGSDVPHTGDSQAFTWTEADLSGRCPLGERIGGVAIGHWDGLSSILGQVLESVPPSAQVAQQVGFGSCVLVRPPSYHCDPPCKAGLACLDDDTCGTYPAPVDVGMVTISGLTSPLVLDPDGNGMFWNTSLEPPLFQSGDPLEVSSDGAAPLALRGVGVAPMECLDPSWTIAPATAITVHWIPVDHGEIEITLMINQHGISPSVLRCVTDDTGTYTIDATVVDALRADAISGLPSATLRRLTADHQETPKGCVDLEVYDHRNIPVEVIQ